MAAARYGTCWYGFKRLSAEGALDGDIELLAHVTEFILGVEGSCEFEGVGLGGEVGRLSLEEGRGEGVERHGDDSDG